MRTDEKVRIACSSGSTAGLVLIAASTNPASTSEAGVASYAVAALLAVMATFSNAIKVTLIANETQVVACQRSRDRFLAARLVLSTANTLPIYIARQSRITRCTRAAAWLIDCAARALIKPTTNEIAVTYFPLHAAGLRVVAAGYAEIIRIAR
jgi:hypothetical protein